MIKQQLSLINNYSYDKIKNTLFYPILDISFEGESIIQQLSIKALPCYLFCKCKNEKTFYVIDKIEGVFFINDFINKLNSNELFNSKHNIITIVIIVA